MRRLARLVNLILECNMTKQRFTSADVAGETACLRTRVLGMRLANLYDIDAKVRTSIEI